LTALAAGAGARNAVPDPRLVPAWSTVARVVEHRALQYRRTFRASIFGSFGIPVLYLVAMGAGLGGYVDRSADPVLHGLSYLQFLAPGLLASTVMQTASFEAMFPILGGLQWNKIFHAMFATPIQPADIVFGNVAWIVFRLSLVGGVFALAIVLFGASASPLVVLAVPCAVLTGLAFATPIMAFTATQRTPDRFATIFRFGVTPLFLFSGTFFPVESLPSFLQPLVWISPLWHGVDLCRQLMLGTIVNTALLGLVHALVLLTLAGVGIAVALRTVEARLVKG
jgi:lipooligosaccharide transport system permease protein